jgi:hypothetical protein
MSEHVEGAGASPSRQRGSELREQPRRPTHRTGATASRSGKRARAGRSSHHSPANDMATIRRSHRDYQGLTNRGRLCEAAFSLLEAVDVDHVRRAGRQAARDGSRWHEPGRQPWEKSTGQRSGVADCCARCDTRWHGTDGVAGNGQRSGVVLAAVSTAMGHLQPVLTR